MKRGIIILSIVLFANMYFVSAGIVVDVPNSLYNLGDVINASVTVSSDIRLVEFLNARLICGEKDIVVYRSSQVINGGEEKKIIIEIAIDNLIVGNVSGECFVMALYGAGQAESQRFAISKDVNVEVSVNNPTFGPGEIVNISGKAIKKNGQPLNGFAEIIIEGSKLNRVKIVETDEVEELDSGEEANEEVVDEEVEENDSAEINSSENATDEKQESEVSEEADNEAETDEVEETEAEASEEQEIIEGELEIFNLVTLFLEVKEGVFSTDFLVPENAPPGNYVIKTKVYDYDLQGNKMNEGEGSNSIRIKQVIKSIALAFSQNSIIPGNEFLYSLVVYDQAEGEGEGEGEVVIYKPDKTVFANKVIKAKEVNPIFIESNFSPGYWEIEARVGEITNSKIFYVEEFEGISAGLEGGRLKIKNIGNVAYNKRVEISIGGISEVKELNLDVGESRIFRLAAPDGEYRIGVNDGETLEDLGVAFLTGRAISIDSIGGLFLGNYIIWIWLVAIAVLLVVIFIILKKIIKKDYVRKTPRLVLPASSIRDKEPLRMGESVIDSGQKQEASLVSLKLKNLDHLQTIMGENKPLDAVNDALMRVKSTGGKIYVDKEYRIIIFAPSITREKDNDLKAISIARDIENILNNYNRIAKTKIVYGIGVHSGDMAIESREGHIKIVSLGNTIAIAKRISEISNGEVFLSEREHRKTLGKVKVEKSAKGDFWIVNRIMDREQYDDFIGKFLNRQRSR